MMQGMACWGLISAALLAGGNEDRPARELREYGVWVDQTLSGKLELEIDERGADAVSVSFKTEVKHTFYKIYNYSYSLHGREQWANGRLLSLRSEANDDGKKFRVQADLRGEENWVIVNDKKRASAEVTWTTLFWNLPDPEALSGEVLILDVDTGAPLKARLSPEKIESIELSGKPRDCWHVRVTEPKVVDLWFDGRRRLVRQVSTEDGFATEIRLKSIRNLATTRDR
ncbi:MAG: hypothetical protein FJ295_08060 [Planctomycetes bacterium]|nr:hypothetical protein [Planctomycetota bacterium]